MTYFTTFAHLPAGQGDHRRTTSLRTFLSWDLDPETDTDIFLLTHPQKHTPLLNTITVLRLDKSFFDFDPTTKEERYGYLYYPIPRGGLVVPLYNKNAVDLTWLIRQLEVREMIVDDILPDAFEMFLHALKTSGIDVKMPPS